MSQRHQTIHQRHLRDDPFQVLLKPPLCLRLAKQRGSGALIMVILLLALSAALLNATRKQLDDGLSRVADERLFLQQTSLAMSALSWGLRQTWPVTKGWECKVDALAGWRACLTRVDDMDELLRGDSGEGTVTHYQWGVRSGESAKINAQPHGWLDYCPLAEEQKCNPDQGPAGL